MKLQLEAKTRVPYGGGYTITDPLSKIEVYGTTFNMVARRIRETRHANGYPEGLGLDDEIEEWICKAYPQECVTYDPRAPRKRSLGISDIVHGTKVMIKFSINGRQLVDKEEAERRAAICAGCKWNVAFVKPCSGLCPELRDLVHSIIGNEKTSHDNELQSCSICACFNSASVWLPLYVQCAGVTEEQKAQFKSVHNCWKQCQ